MARDMTQAVAPVPGSPGRASVGAVAPVSDRAPRLLGPTGEALPAGIGSAVRTLAAMRGGATEVGVRAGSPRGQDLAGWLPAQTSADAAWLGGRDLAVARVRDLVANEPWAQAAIDRKSDLVVGSGWRPSIKPDGAALGLSDDDAVALGRGIERVWRLWAEDPLARCDTAETLSGGLLLNVIATEAEVSGDGLAVLRFDAGSDWLFRTSVQLVDSDRLSNPMGRPNSALMKGGVELDARERPIAYHIRNGHPGDYGIIGTAASFTWERIERREPWGRPKVLHLFDKVRPGQTRGVSKLVAALERFKQLSRFAQHELTNAVINALFAASITSSFDPAVVQDQFGPADMRSMTTLRDSFYDTARLQLGGVGIQHLFPGDELKFNASPRQTAAFEGFTTVFLRAIASSLGLAYEQLTMDWSKTTYSSARAALLEVWRGVMKARARVASMIATPLLLAIVEDAIDSGELVTPLDVETLYERPAAVLRGQWLGPARGHVDPVKEPLGQLMRIEAGLSTFEDEAAEQGRDFDLIPPQLARERRLYAEHGLMPPALQAMIGASALAGDPQEPAPAAS